MIDYICSHCGVIYEKDSSGDGTPCPECNPMKWMSKVKSPAGKIYLKRFHNFDPDFKMPEVNEQIGLF